MLTRISFYFAELGLRQKMGLHRLLEVVNAWHNGSCNSNWRVGEKSLDQRRLLSFWIVLVEGNSKGLPLRGLSPHPFLSHYQINDDINNCFNLFVFHQWKISPRAIFYKLEKVVFDIFMYLLARFKLQNKQPRGTNVTMNNKILLLTK